MIHPHTELRFINDTIGFGVVATAPIPRGTITWTRDPLDRAMSPEEALSLDPLFRAQIDKFTFTDGVGARILCWDIAKYVNHSCEPTCLAPGFDFEIAVRDIAPGEQLCDDYGTLNLLEPFECACGWRECRGIIRPDDPLRLADQWDDLVRRAFPGIARVEQPLWPLVGRRAEVEAAILDASRIPTCRVHFGAVALVRPESVTNGSRAA
jgi:hypothetical protein